MYTPIAGFKANPQNINRKGAPKREWTMAGLIEQAMEEQDESGVPYKIGISKKLIKLAHGGDMVAIKEIANRMDGMPQQNMDLTTLGERINFNIDEVIGLSNPPTQTTDSIKEAV